MTQEEIDRKLWEWCEFKWATKESYLRECEAYPFSRCFLCITRARLWYALHGHIRYDHDVGVFIREILNVYKEKGGKVVRP